MILVGVGQHQAKEVATLLQEIADIRQHQIDAGQGFVAEGHT